MVFCHNNKFQNYKDCVQLDHVQFKTVLVCERSSINSITIRLVSSVCIHMQFKTVLVCD